MGVVHVAHLETRTLTRQTAGTQGRKTALVGDFGQRIGLVHKLRQCVGAEESVDHRRDRLGVDKVDRLEHFVVAHVHLLTDGARDTRESDAELIVELLADSTHPAVAEVVDIIHIALGVDKTNEILDNLYYVLAGENLHVHRSVETEFLVYAVTAHFSEVVALLAEEKALDYLACGCGIRRLRVAQLPIDIADRLLLAVGDVLLKCVENYAVVHGADILLLQKNSLDTAFQYLFHVVLRDFVATVHHDCVALIGGYLAGIGINEILKAAHHHTARQFAADHSLKIGAGNSYFFGEVENLDYILVRLEPDGTEKSSDR